MADAVRLVAAGALEPADPTPGMAREAAVVAGPLWSGLVHTDPGAVSGWHHHGEHQTSLYLVRGRMRLEFGPGGAGVAEAGPGDFLHVPPHAVHRERNPTLERSTAVIARAGYGQVTVNVDGPDPA